MSEKGGIRDPVKKLASTEKEKHLGAFETYGYAEYKSSKTTLDWQGLGATVAFRQLIYY